MKKREVEKLLNEIYDDYQKKLYYGIFWHSWGSTYLEKCFKGLKKKSINRCKKNYTYLECVVYTSTLKNSPDHKIQAFSDLLEVILLKVGNSYLENCCCVRVKDPMEVLSRTDRYLLPKIFEETIREIITLEEIKSGPSFFDQEHIMHHIRDFLRFIGEPIAILSNFDKKWLNRKPSEYLNRSLYDE